MTTALRGPRQRIRHGTTVEFTAENPVLRPGELTYDSTEDAFKIGDGVTAWLDLPYIAGGGGIPGPHTHVLADITDAGALAAKDTIDATALLDNSVVTYPKIQDVTATDRVLGRATSGAGVIEEITFTGAARTFAAATTAALQRAALALGALAVLNTVATAQIDNSAVTYAKIQDVSATDKVLGRVSSGAGVVEEIALTAAGRALIDDANATAQRATLGLGALAVLNTVATAQIDNNAVTYAKIQQVSATDKLLGRSTAGAGNVEEIALTSAGRALIDDADASAQRTTLGLGALATKSTVATADIDNDAVTYAKVQNVSATDRVLGRATAGAGDIEEITFTSTARSLVDDTSVSAMRTTLGLGALATLSTVATAQIDNDAVTYAKIQNVSATDRVLGRSTAGSGDVEEITFTSTARSLVDDASVAAMRATLDVPARAGTDATGTWGISVTGTSSNITAYTIDQNLGTGNSPTFGTPRVLALELNSTAVNFRAVWALTSTSLRNGLHLATNEAESGANAGSNVALWAYSDAGASLGAYFTGARATRVVTFPQTIVGSINGNAGTVTNGVYTTGSYADPAWITSLAGTKVSGNISGNAATATTLQTARNINGVSFNGSADVTVTAAAGTLTGATLAAGVTASSLTSVGTLTSLAISGDLTLTGTGSDVIIAATAKFRPDGSASGDTYWYEQSANRIDVVAGGGGSATFESGLLYAQGLLAIGATQLLYLNYPTNTVYISNAMVFGGADIKLHVSTADYVFYTTGFTMPALAKFWLDSGGDTYLQEYSANVVGLWTGGTQVFFQNSTGIGLAAQGQKLYLSPGGATYIDEYAANAGRVTVNSSVIMYWGATTTGSLQLPSIGTTGSAANAFLDSGNSNNVLRSTSSLRYKRDVRTMGLEEARVLVLQAQPIIYKGRGKSDGDREFFGLVAERMAELDPRAVTVDAAGRPDWVQYPHLVAPLMLIAQDHETRLAALEQKTKHLPA